MPRSRDNGAAAASENLPSIRFSSYYDARAPRPSLSFLPVSRTLPTGSEVIKVGRYSERDAQPQVPPNTPSAAPVGFKSKVVSRRHCEFWFENGKWYIKDVKSSSGTFLNHIRLSPPGTESKPYIVNDGDIIQLGIDFKGGEEMIFRCVKMRLELNRGWQSKLNNFKYVRPTSLSTPLQQRPAPRSRHLPSNMAIAPFNFVFEAYKSNLLVLMIACLRTNVSETSLPMALAATRPRTVPFA